MSTRAILSGAAALAACTLICAPATAQQPAIGSAAELTRLVLHDPTSPTAGNPRGDVTVVAFLDYNCPFCRRATPQLDAFLKTDPNVRVVYKDWPILAPSSITEAKVALAAAYQGMYQQAHDALMAIAIRPATKDAIKAAVESAGVDVARLDKDLAAHNDAIDAILARDNAEAEALGLQGTPVFLVGPFKIAQELDEAGFRQAVADARARQGGAPRPHDAQQ